MKRLRKMLIGLCLSSLVIFMFAGCCCKTRNYTEFALQELNNKYGEEFAIKQKGGTFGATNNNKKLMCYPVRDETIKFEVQVKRDLSKVYDNYEARLLEQLTAEKIEKYTKEYFGEEVIIKPHVDGARYASENYKKIDFDNLNFEEYMREQNYSVVIDIFVKGKNNSQSPETIYNYVDNISKYGLEGIFMASVYYIKEDAYKDLERQYDKLHDPVGSNGTLMDYLRSKEVMYATTISSIKDGVMDESVEEINEIMERNTNIEYTKLF